MQPNSSRLNTSTCNEHHRYCRHCVTTEEPLKSIRIALHHSTYACGRCHNVHMSPYNTRYDRRASTHTITFCFALPPPLMSTPQRSFSSRSSFGNRCRDSDLSTSLQCTILRGHSLLTYGYSAYNCNSILLRQLNELLKNVTDFVHAAVVKEALIPAVQCRKRKS